MLHRTTDSSSNFSSGVLARLRRSLRQRGVVATLHAAATYADDAVYDLRHGMWTVAQERLDELTIMGDRHGGVDCAPSSARSFRRTLDHFGVPTAGRFVDFGCGKGRALVLAQDYGFKDVLGIEFAAELQRAAQRLVTRNAADGRRAEVLLSDARSYRIDPVDRVFYFFNPFDAAVLKDVLSNVDRSLTATPRDAWLIYANPEHRDVIDSSPVWRYVGERRFASGHRYVCFRAAMHWTDAGDSTGSLSDREALDSPAAASPASGGAWSRATGGVQQ